MQKQYVSQYEHCSIDSDKVCQKKDEYSLIIMCIIIL
jgi:hypothetical protein